MKLSRWVGLIGTSILGSGLTACGSQANAAHQPKKIVIALSNSYIGNDWRTQMVNAFSAAARTAKQQGQISSFEVINSNNTASEQVSQLDTLILKHVSAIVIDAASSTALNGVIAKAHNAGIPVISFDNVVTSPYAYKINYNLFRWGSDAANYIVKRLHGSGNVVLVRGIAGTPVDQSIYKGWMSVLSKHPGIKVVGSVYGNWTEATAQSKVASLIPSLPHINAILAQGSGEGYGAIQAFKAAGRSTPLVFGGNSGYFLHWWAKQSKATHYTTKSESNTPGVGGAAFYVALSVVKGVHVPHSMTMPLLTITQKTLSQYSNIPLTDVASPKYTYTWVKSHLLK